MSSLRVPRQAVGQARSAQLLAEHYASARVSVLRKARGDLRSANHFVTDLDLDAAYNGAWLDLVAQVDAGAEVDNPPGWLVIATKRRAIDGRRSDHASRELPLTAARQLSIAGDEMVDQIDRSDAVRAAAAVARHKFSERDGRVAALLLTGHSRGEISMKTGLPLKRLHKILDGHKGRRGLLEQLDAYVAAIANGAWCDANGSLIRAYTLRVLAPDSPKIAEAQAHLRSCAACRAYSVEYGRVQEQLGASMAPVWALASAEIEERVGLLRHVGAALRSVGESARTLLGIGGADGAAAAGSGVSLGGGALAFGGFTAGRAITAGCVAAVSVGCIAAATGVLPGTSTDGSSKRPSAVVRRASSATSPTAPSTSSIMATVVPPALSPTAPFPTSASDALLGKTGEASASRTPSSQERSSPLAPPDEFAFEAGGTRKAAPRARHKAAKPTRDMNIENQTAAPAATPVAPTTASSDEGAEASSTGSAATGTGTAGASAGSGSSGRSSTPPAAAPAPKPQRETFGIER